MADTKLRSPDGFREAWFNEKEVAHLTNKEPGERWTIVVTDEKPPRDPHDPIEEEAVEPEEAPITEPTEEAPTRPAPKPMPKAKVVSKGKIR
jgi:hypothetical protein